MDYSEVFVWICFIIIIISVIFIIAAFYNITSVDDKPKKGEYLELDSVKTGDIIAVSYRAINGYIISAWSASTWSHTGLIWRDPETDIPYVLEACSYRSLNMKGVIKIPLYKWLILNRKNMKGIVRYKGTDIDPYRMIDEFNKFSDCKLEGFNQTWKRFLVTRELKDDDFRANGEYTSYTCFEITIIVLQKLDVMDKKYTASSYFPDHIMNLNVHGMRGKYNECIQIELEH